MIPLKRLSNSVYQSEDGIVLIRKVISQRNSGRRTEKEILWTVQILNHELPMAEESLKEARATAMRWIKESLQLRIDSIHKQLLGANP